MAGWRHWVVAASVAFAWGDSSSADWTRFRGPNGSGIAPAGETVPADGVTPRTWPGSSSCPDPVPALQS